ncbi:MAG: hypothetical protein H7Y31_17435 [Chitinophagaceae bacterium]|nr:hypothetical protein [Chitinophagaceae bacterium]
MKHNFHVSKKIILRSVLVTSLFIAGGMTLLSFSVARMNTEFLKQLGIGKSDADKKITRSILGGSLDAYGLKNAKNIALGNRTAVAKELLIYTKAAVNTEAFKKEYKEMKDSYKPEFVAIQTPEDFKKETLARYRKMVADAENNVKSANADLKPIFQTILTEGQKQLKEYENPKNQAFIRYEKSYPETVSFNQQNYDHRIKLWEENYPTNHLLFVKKRLIDFMAETADIDFNAELKERDGRKVFVNRAYESKGNRWKMAFRAGKQVVAPAREFVEKWIGEIE